MELVERKLEGTFHVSGGERVSRLRFAEMVCEVIELDSSLINPVQMSRMNWRARRPRDSSLDVSKAASLLSEKPLLLPDALLKLKHALTGGNAG